MSLLLSALSHGFIFGLLALGVLISFRIFAIPDITVDGSITFGGAVCAVLLVNGWPPLGATMMGGAAGFLAGAVTGILQTRCGINPLLAGILVMTALYSVNLHVMGRSNLPLLDVTTLADQSQSIALRLFGREEVAIGAWVVPGREIVMLLAFALISCSVALALYLFFRTDLGTAMRVSGNNGEMARALGVNVKTYQVLGLALANGLVGTAGALWVQAQGFADAQMGIGAIVIGLASVIIGEAIVAGGRGGLGLALCGALIGSILFRQLIALAIRGGLDPNDLKLATATFVFVALVLPRLLVYLREKYALRGNVAAIER
ncbi:MAG TPA: hypothetical protein VNQ90_03275 [Chthoniobacteraceae bacterium]|nr:hypothetical protein [Chthoniobacteraceae bacterium]